MKIYIAGKTTGKENYKLCFQSAEAALIAKGHQVINPCCLPEGLEHEEYIHICKAMIDVCDAVYLLHDWEESEGAKIEREYAHNNNTIIFTTFELITEVN